MIKKRLTILSFGAGQDSTAILYMIIHDPEFKKKYVKGKLIVVFANTRNEKIETYLHLERIKLLCKKHNIPFVTVGSEYRTGEWIDGLIAFYEAGNRVGSKAFPKTCTDKLKIQPIYKWLDEFLFQKGFGKRSSNGQLRKTAIKQFVQENEKIHVLIGIAAKEEKRASSNEESPSAWMRDCINKLYPLIDLGMDRQACQDYIKQLGYKIPVPSACILCPFMNDIELLHLYRFNRPWFDKWVELEANKIAANLDKGEQNLGVWGKKLLPQKIIEVQEKYGHMTTEELEDYVMSHGHCVMSKY
jgi:hypothetical protein